MNYKFEQDQTLAIPWEFGHRFDLINALAAKISAQTYLEIGCAGNDTFDRVEIPTRIGVDPRDGGTLRMTSDEFFAQNTQKFDVIFVDGLHHYDQVSRDIHNGLQVLNSHGFMVIHDVLPKQQQEAQVPRDQDWQGPWTGDVWRAAFDLLSRSDVTLQVVPVDCGCGIVYKKSQTPKQILVENSWAWFSNHWHELPLIGYREAIGE